MLSRCDCEDEEKRRLRRRNTGISDFNAYTYTLLPELVMPGMFWALAYVRAMNKNNVASSKGCFSVFFLS